MQAQLQSPPLAKTSSQPSLQDTSDSSCNSIDSLEDEYRKCAARWILSYSRKVSRSTQYLALAYLGRFVSRSVSLCGDNYEKIAVALVLMASKMNEIYPPKISSMLARCKRTHTKEEIIAIEHYVLSVLDFEVALPDTPYSLISQLVAERHPDKLEECEKLLRVVSPSREVFKADDETLAYAVVYLILPQFVRDLQLPHASKVKTLAIQLYAIYNETRRQYEVDK